MEATYATCSQFECDKDRTEHTCWVLVYVMYHTLGTGGWYALNAVPIMLAGNVWLWPYLTCLAVGVYGSRRILLAVSVYGKRRALRAGGC